MHWDILDKKRTDFLPSCRFTKAQGFYLAGGTGLALQIGHRDSIDFDFFTEKDIVPDEVFAQLKVETQGRNLTIVQKEKNTLSVIVDQEIKLSFFGYHYPLLFPLVDSPSFSIASVRDIAAMKLSAITSRSLEKDYVDLYYILQTCSLANILGDAKQKFPELDQSVILKALVYFDDVEQEHILFKHGYALEFAVVKEFLRNKVKALLTA